MKVDFNKIPKNYSIKTFIYGTGGGDSRGILGYKYRNLIS